MLILLSLTRESLPITIVHKAIPTQNGRGLNAMHLAFFVSLISLNTDFKDNESAITKRKCMILFQGSLMNECISIPYR